MSIIPAYNSLSSDIINLPSYEFKIKVLSDAVFSDIINSTRLVKSSIVTVLHI